MFCCNLMASHSSLTSRDCAIPSPIPSLLLQVRPITHTDCDPIFGHCRYHRFRTSPTARFPGSSSRSDVAIFWFRRAYFFSASDVRMPRDVWRTGNGRRDDNYVVDQRFVGSQEVPFPIHGRHPGQVKSARFCLWSHSSDPHSARTSMLFAGGQRRRKDRNDRSRRPSSCHSRKMSDVVGAFPPNSVAFEAIFRIGNTSLSCSTKLMK